MEDIVESGLQEINNINLKNYTKNILNKKRFPNNKNQVYINSVNLENDKFYFIVNNIIVEEDNKLKVSTKKYSQLVHYTILLEVLAEIINKQIICMIDNNKNINNTGETICIDCSNEDENYQKNIQNIKHKALNTLAVKKFATIGKKTKSTQCILILKQSVLIYTNRALNLIINL